MEMGL
jgi:hypothetical protein